MPNTFTLRIAHVGDAEIIAEHRRAMFVDMGMEVPANSVSLFIEWVRPRLIDKTYLGWFLTLADGQVIAGAGLWLIEWPPTPIDLSITRGYLLNVFVQPDYRRQGLAHQLMDVVLDYCAQQHIRVIMLHASNKGRPLYESLGFVGTNEMRLVRNLDETSAK